MLFCANQIRLSIQPFSCALSALVPEACQANLVSENLVLSMMLMIYIFHMPPTWGGSYGENKSIGDRYLTSGEASGTTSSRGIGGMSGNSIFL